MELKRGLDLANRNQTGNYCSIKHPAGDVKVDVLLQNETILELEAKAA
ncbi:MAG: hypothetical protein GXO89_10810 [Chlorobi bacterium]|nr:hypothetical protein [Chlorobiota bacterium]